MRRQVSNRTSDRLPLAEEAGCDCCVGEDAKGSDERRADSASCSSATLDSLERQLTSRELLRNDGNSNNSFLDHLSSAKK